MIELEVSESVTDDGIMLKAEILKLHPFWYLPQTYPKPYS